MSPDLRANVFVLHESINTSSQRPISFSGSRKASFYMLQ